MKYKHFTAMGSKASNPRMLGYMYQQQQQQSYVIAFRDVILVLRLAFSLLLFSITTGFIGATLD